MDSPTNKSKTLPTNWPVVMGILNVTPDSFSDGGQFPDVAHAVKFAEKMIEDGVGIIDVGPESTRPGATGVAGEEQIARAIPVLRAIREVYQYIPLSIDTRNAEVAKAALAAGADMVNDVSALRDDPAMAETVAAADCLVVLMHRRGISQSMQSGEGPTYHDVIGEIEEFLLERIEHAKKAGIDPARIVIDPGVGFGKRVEHNLAIVRNLRRFTKIGYPVLLGVSRKRFLGSVLQLESPATRDAASLACAAWAAEAGVAVLRVHDVRPTAHMAQLYRAMNQTF